MDMNTPHIDYRVNLEVFEGPLDLLMHLIKKNDLDVYDIPVAFVLEEYMRYLDTLKELDIDLAGDFLLMAAELAHIKSRLLLPDDISENEAEEEGDPRAELVRRLLEYQQFKEAGENLTNRSMLGRDVFVPKTRERIETDEQGPIEGSVYELVEAFSKILKKTPAEGVHDVAVDRISINDRIYQILDLVKKGTTINIGDLIAELIDRYHIVITFIALLEMCRLKMIRVYQSEPCGAIHIQGLLEEVSEDEVMHLVEVEATGFEKPDESK